MSFKYYVHWWIQNKGDLEAIKKQDVNFLKSPAVTERSIANKLVGGMYAKYCMIVQQLDLSLDQLAQPQKTVTIRKLVDSAVMRLKELYNELRWIDFSEFHYIDDSLVELKLIPHDIEILHPYLSYPRPYDLQQMYEKIKNGQKIYTRVETIPETEEQTEEETHPVPVPVPPPEEPDTSKKDKKKRKSRPVNMIMDKKAELTPEEIETLKQQEMLNRAIILIQTHERARQCRLYHKESGSMYTRNRENANGQKVVRPERTPEERDHAARILQKAFKWHFMRNYLRKKDQERRVLIGMYETSYRSRKEFEKEEEEIEKRRQLRELRIKEYIESNLAEKERILRVVGPGLVEDVGDEIREWFRIWYTQVKNFDKIPPDEKGGTILIVRGETMTPEEWKAEVERKRRAKVKAGGDKAAKEKLKKEKAKIKEQQKKAKKAKAEALKKAKQEKKKRRNTVNGYQMEFDDPEGDVLYKQGQNENKLIWDDRDELLNPLETHYMDLINDQRCYEVQLEVRKYVDELMRVELELLNDALARDKNKKPKKPKKPKRKKKKKKGKKQPKDITADRTTEDLFQELVDNGIIRMYPKTRLDEFIGDFSYCNFELRDEFLDPPQTLGDVRQALVVNGILPLGLEECKNRPRSMIICGPPLSGKKLLANAIFTATRCVLFDLSPEVIAGKYPDKQGLAMLAHLVMKMAKLLAPSILFINGAEKTFYKKVPPAEKDLEPKRLGKVLMKKMVKFIKPPDRVMLLSISSQPWAASLKMKKVYEKAILVPRSDYGSVFLYWRHLLMPYHSIHRNIDLSCLTKLTVTYPLGAIKEVVAKVMQPERIVELIYTPLTQLELYEPLLSMQPVTDKTWKKFLKWYAKTPVGKLGKRFAKFKGTQRAEIVKKKEQEEKMKEKQNKRK